MSVEHVEIRAAYADSITLLQVSQLVAAHEHVEAATVAMGTPLNVDVLAGLGFTVPPVEATEMLVALRVRAGEHLASALAAVDEAFAAVARPTASADAQVAARTTASALRRAPADVVLVSVPGPSATTEAMDALHAGAHVLVFSDNVPVEQEVALKEEAGRRGLLVMGPDCGTAIVGGVGLGFANVVAPGPVGVVAASGTGCQQLISLLDTAGVGISAALGVGGRDLSAQVGGRATIQALRRLDEDPATELIVVVSKPPAPSAAATVREAAAGCRTPVRLALLGPGQPDLAAAAASVLSDLGRPVPAWPSWGGPLRPRPGYLRGLFCGGTLRAEAAVVAGAALGAIGTDLGAGHAMVDFGDDALTAGRAHPMIDPSLRLDQLARCAADPATGVLLVDVVLGHGSHPDPAADLAPVIASSAAPVVVACVGTAGDPQGTAAQVETLVAAGAAVFAANADAARYAISLLTGPVPPGRPVGGSGPGLPAPVRAGAAGPSSLPQPPSVLNVGADLLADAVAGQGADVHRVDWQPPMPGTAADLATVATDPLRADANAEAVARLLAAAPMLVDVAPAAEVLGLGRGELLHAGPPISWAEASGPLRGALMGACAFEGWADSPQDAVALLSRDAVALEPCHHRGAVGPMAGVVSASMWMLVVEDATTGRRAFCSLNEGLGAVLRYGAYGPDVLHRLRWMAAVLGPLLRAAVRASGPVDVGAILGQMLQMGDEGHNRNRAGTLMLLRDLAPALVGGGPGADVAEVLRFVGGNDHFFLNVGMPACKVALDAARDVPGSTMVVAMARNGTEFGIQTAGTGDRWFTGPAQLIDGLYLGGYGPQDANPDIGDSAITETAGLGGFAMATAPAIVRFVGGAVPDALATTRRMYEITLAEHPRWTVPVLEFRGVPAGIDVAAVARTGILPQINTGMAGRVAGVGQVGAGLVTPPAEIFPAAVAALAEAARARAVR